MNKQTLVGLASVVLGIVGILNTGYLSYERLSGKMPQCTPPFLCREVLESPFLNVGPLPISVFGVLYFLVVLGLGTAIVLQEGSESQSKKDEEDNADLKKPNLLLKYAWYWAVFGLAFALYTLAAMTFFIGGYCPYCLISDLLLGLNFVVLFAYRTTLSIQAPKK